MADYFQPGNLDEALTVMQSRPVTIVAGGTDYFPARGHSPVQQDILDVTRIQGLRDISLTADGDVRIGAAATWSDVVNADLPPCFDGLKAAGREVGSIQIQNAGTIAGNMCNASPAADGVPPLLTLDAEIELAGPNGRRMLPLSQFILGPRQTALTEEELVVAFHIPALRRDVRGAFTKIGARKYLVISITMTAVCIGLGPDKRIDFARVAVGACSPVALRLTELEHALIGQRPDAVEISEAHLSSLAPISDIRADAVYRREAVAHQIKRAIAAASDNG